MATQSGKVICWIDSKATFGDEAQHRCPCCEAHIATTYAQYQLLPPVAESILLLNHETHANGMCRVQTKEQFSKYVNRYGPGAVIYWAGFVVELEKEAAAEHLVLLTDVPGDLIQLPRLQM